MLRVVLIKALAFALAFASSTAFHQAFTSSNTIRTRTTCSPVVLLATSEKIEYEEKNSGDDEPKTVLQISSEENAQEMLEKARQLRLEIERANEGRKIELNERKEEPEIASRRASPWLVEIPSEIKEKISMLSVYRLYLDIGREKGTWMDPRWGASGRRIKCTVDVGLVVLEDGQCGVISAQAARLRDGFDRMACRDGTFRVETAKKQRGSSTIKFSLVVDGTPETGSSYGDVNIPQGSLFFAIPCFGSSTKKQISNISSKEGTITVQQMGWHTGWRRRESRIVGTFRCVPIDKAQKMDGF